MPMWTEKLGGGGKKENMEVATGRTCSNYEWSLGAWHAREFFTERVFLWTTDLFPEVAQTKAVLSCAMTSMDQICGLGEDEKWVGSLFAGFLWVCYKCVLCDGQETTHTS